MRKAAFSQIGLQEEANTDVRACAEDHANSITSTIMEKNTKLFIEKEQKHANHTCFQMTFNLMHVVSVSAVF